MKKRIALIGAGSAQFGYGTIGDILQSNILEGSHIVLHDINPDTLKIVEQTGLAFLAEHKLPFTVSATTNRKEALQGADFVALSNGRTRYGFVLPVGVHALWSELSHDGSGDILLNVAGRDVYRF